ncbi:MAG: hypothetical protein JWO90_1546 [Solirubrobacterales bacterium]|nr:hypothetical protein [Solirubrobacterales bacterium]
MTVRSLSAPAVAEPVHHSVGSPAGAVPPGRRAVEADEAGRMGDDAKTARQRSTRFLRPRRVRGQMVWDADEIAAYLLDRQRQIVRGLGRRSPWAGMDDETLDSCYHHAAAVIAKVAEDGQRADWSKPQDLERAVVSAFRHQAYDHWKRVNAQHRQADRHTVPFDPERHAPDDTPLDRLFEQPDLHTIKRDLLSELQDPRLRQFWTVVLTEEISFRAAGDRLGLSKVAVSACTKQGRAAFAGYLSRRASGQLCRDRTLDIAAHRAGIEDLARTERALAHLESCYACALVHEPRTSAIQRGILSLAPTGLILRMLSRAGDVAATPAMRIADSGSGSRAVAAGLAALAVGTGAGVQLVEDSTKVNAKPADVATQDAARSGTTPPPARTASGQPRPGLFTTAPAPPPAVQVGRQVRRSVRRVSPRVKSQPVVTRRLPTSPQQQPLNEFDPERLAQAPAAPTPTPPPSPAQSDFGLP